MDADVLRFRRPEDASEGGRIRSNLRQLDWGLLFAILALTAIGIVVLLGTGVGSSDLEMAARRQGVWLGVSLVAMVVILFLDFSWLNRLAPVAYLLNLGLLLAVLVGGSRINGAKSWFTMGPINFQPSEPMKILAALMLARWYALRPEGVVRWRDLIAPALICGVPAALIQLQPDFGTASLFVLLFGVVLIWAGVTREIFIVLAFAAIITPVAIYPMLKPYQKERILNFVHPERDPKGTGYNVIQARIAVGSGQIAGRGIGEGTQCVKRFLPEAHTDFIFASAVEQTGLIGGVVIIALFAAVGLRMLHAVKLARDRFGGLTVVALGAIFFGHVFLNLGMVMGLVPVTGLPLPFLSYGGSYLLSTYILMAIILNIGMRRFVFV